MGRERGNILIRNNLDDSVFITLIGVDVTRGIDMNPFRVHIPSNNCDRIST